MAVKKKNTTADIIPIEAYDDECECFMTKTGCFDILQVRCRDIYSASDSVLEYEIYAYTRLYRTYEKPLKLVCLNFPTDTSRQQSYVEHLLNKTVNPYTGMSCLKITKSCRPFHYLNTIRNTIFSYMQERRMSLSRTGISLFSSLAVMDCCILYPPLKRRIFFFK